MSETIIELGFYEKSTNFPICGVRVLVTKNGIENGVVKTDESGCVKLISKFNVGEYLGVSIEKLTGGYKNLGSFLIDEENTKIKFLSPKVKINGEAQKHTGDPQRRTGNKNNSKNHLHDSREILEKLSELDEIIMKRDENSKSEAPIRQAKQIRSESGHPKILVVNQEPHTSSPTPITGNSIPNLLFPLHERPKESYKERPRKFGSGRSNKRMHAGIDLYAPVDTPVRAMADGVVVRVYAFYLGTHVIEVNHGTFMARYGEVKSDKVLVKNGEKIKRGQLIGVVGKLKGINESMLHLELYSTTESPGVRDFTQRNNPPFQRRDDLMDPTISIDNAVME